MICYARFLRALLMIHALIRISGSYGTSHLRSFCSLHARKAIRVKMSLTMKAKIFDCDNDGIEQAANILKRGGLVAFPTETVYGLGANALNDASVKSIFAAKKRPASDPLIVHVLSKDNIYDLFDFNDSDASRSDQIDKKSRPQLVCEILSETFWPGPLTIVFRAKPVVPSAVTSGTGYVGVRSPRHPIARRLLEAAALPVAAPSANRFGHVSPTSPEHVYDDLGEEDIGILRDDVALSGGCTVGIESTVCRVANAGDTVSILRCGAVTSTDIAHALQRASHILDVNWLADVKVVIENEKALIKNKHDSSSADVRKSQEENNGDSAGEGEGAVAPGQMIKHYAPDVPTYVVDRSSGVALPEMHSTSVVRVPDSERPVLLRESFVIDFGGQLSSMKTACAIYTDLSPSASTEEACNKLFSVLRDAEAAAAGSANGSRSSAGSDGDGDGDAVSTSVRISAVLLPDLRSAAEDPNREMVRALWERLHRAASGTFGQAEK